jgi:hypothetical protein
MPDVFISYSSKDEKMAQFLRSHLQQQEVSVFMASMSLQLGQHWSAQILSNLKTSSWVLFLASREACQSPYVQQEVGAALVQQKKLVPIIWEIDPSELPGWAKQYQALNLAGVRTLDEIRIQINVIAQKIKSDKAVAVAILGAIVLGILSLL